MRHIPINFKAWEVRAVLEGRKTQFRRIVKPQPLWEEDPGQDEDGLWCGRYVRLCGNPEDPDVSTEVDAVRCPYLPNDRLWCREPYQPLWDDDYDADGLPDWKTGAGYKIRYMADSGPCEYYDEHHNEITGRISPSVHMPRWASRLTLEVLSVRVQRLQEISEEDAVAEGIEKIGFYDLLNDHERAARIARLSGAKCIDYYVRKYRDLWGSMNGKDSWSSNPWVWCVEFKQVQQQGATV